MFAQIQFTTLNGKYDLDATTFQIAILFLWNDRRDAKLTLDEIRTRTDLPDLELRKTLQVRLGRFALT